MCTSGQITDHGLDNDSQSCLGTPRRYWDKIATQLGQKFKKFGVRLEQGWGMVGAQDRNPWGMIGA